MTCKEAAQEQILTRFDLRRTLELVYRFARFPDGNSVGIERRDQIYDLGDVRFGQYEQRGEVPRGELDADGCQGPRIMKAPGMIYGDRDNIVSLNLEHHQWVERGETPAVSDSFIRIAFPRPDFSGIAVGKLIANAKSEQLIICEIDADERIKPN